jgi:hypothetical protein
VYTFARPTLFIEQQEVPLRADKRPAFPLHLDVFRVWLAPVGKANDDGHRWFHLYWYVFKPASPTVFLHMIVLSPFPFPRFFFGANKPHNDEVTLSVPHRANVAGFTLIVTLDSFLLGWRTHDLDTAYLPFATDVGVHVDTSDPIFVERQLLPPRPDEHPAFPLNLDAFRARIAAGNEQAQEVYVLRTGWLQEANSFFSCKLRWARRVQGHSGRQGCRRCDGCSHGRHYRGRNMVRPADV